MTQISRLSDPRSAQPMRGQDAHYHIVPMPVLNEGVGNALRAAFPTGRDDARAEMEMLLNRMQ